MEKVRALYKWGNPRKELKVRFTRLPVILRMKRKGKTTEVMVVHTKSKISELQKAKQWEKKNKAAVISAIFSRQKLSQEMNVIRKYIAHRLYTKNAEAVIVMGDMNDGITRDLIDEHYLLHSIVHELRGAFHHEVALMRHVLTGKQKKRDAWTVEFRDATNKGRTRRVLLDHILFSPACYDGGRFCFVKNSGTIEHKVFDKYIVRRGATRDERPSDHKPLSARFALI
jgi:endonuclease/exonuclease/phosphatase family metal-dependent hydrolase